MRRGVESGGNDVKRKGVEGGGDNVLRRGVERGAKGYIEMICFKRGYVERAR